MFNLIFIVMKLLFISVKTIPAYFKLDYETSLIKAGITERQYLLL